MSKEAFEVERKVEPFYTGGCIFLTCDICFLYCLNNGRVTIYEFSKGMPILEIGEPKWEGEPEDPINSFVVNEDDHTIITHHVSGLFKHWDDTDGMLNKAWKSMHKGPVFRLELRAGKILASGGTDGTLRLWDLENNTCTHSLKGLQGVVSVLRFHGSYKIPLIFASGMENVIHGWDYNDGSLKCKLSGHFSEVTALSFHNDHIHMVSAGRDKIMILWDIQTFTAIRTIPTFEGFESIFVLNPNAPVPFSKEEKDIYVAAAGEKGNVKIYNASTGVKVYEQTNSFAKPAKEEGGLSVTHLLYCYHYNMFAMVTADHNIHLYHIETFECTQQAAGYSDEILDVAFLGSDLNPYVAVATNSPDIKFYELETMRCKILCGHENIVLALATTEASYDLMVSSDKDGSIRLWKIIYNNPTTTMHCVAVGTRHIAGVGSLAIAPMLVKFFISVSQDGTLNMWDVPEFFKSYNATHRDKEPEKLNVLNSIRAHEKDINSVTVSPNDKLIATASQDKTAKIWSVDNLKLLGVLKGHRRGVWCVRFSPIDQVILTTSADCTIKLWSLSELNCLKTLQGHESSVLRAEFLSRGTQLLSSGGDGLVKLWSIKTSECIANLGEHEDKVWALGVSSAESHVVTGGRNSLLVVWRDVTEERKQKAIKEQEEQVLGEQKLANLMKSKQLSDALGLALKLDKPFLVLKIVQDIINMEEGELAKAIKELKQEKMEALMKCVIVWNMNSRNTEVAQTVINIMININSMEDLRYMGVGSHLEALIPYTTRHFKRITKLLQDIHLLDFTVNQTTMHSVSESTSQLSLDDEMTS